ncbi:hypothetical protein BOO88_16640 [Stutzerimonas stutzeri]|nr:hypothetical protein BOO89_02260 [Stutzerimonas stutzeri]AZO90463.1 hypothetical protein BOO88_16640 [Stutzerimonas stutzeri]
MIMHNHVTPSNTSDVVTGLGKSQTVSCHTMSSREIAYQPRINSGYMTHKVTALKPDPETGIERAAFEPVVTPKSLARLAEFNVGASL